jgi:hypothetical protein
MQARDLSGYVNYTHSVSLGKYCNPVKEKVEDALVLRAKES